jgi:hypothetical protein
MNQGPIQGTESDPRLPRLFAMTVIAQDPSISVRTGGVLLARVDVPAHSLEPGPRGPRFHVVDYEITNGTLRSAVSLTDPKAVGALRGWSFRDAFSGNGSSGHTAAELESEWIIHAQNVYAIAANTLASFEFALGRRVPWAFGDHQLYLVPHALREANAYYSDSEHAILFGSFPDTGGRLVHTCLSHDIVAHETTHAILDGLRNRFDQPALPDQDAFHEGFADVVALLSVFSRLEVVMNLLGDVDANGTIAVGEVTENALRQNALFALAEQMGGALSEQRGSALRRSVELAPTSEWRDHPDYEEPHRRGEVLVAVVMKTLLWLWLRRLAPITRDIERVDAERVAEEGSKAAGHLLTMMIRAIDYSPPVELEFEDFLAAIVWSDSVVAPDDDRYGYRECVIESFGAFGILMNVNLITDLSTRPGAVVYQNLNFAAMHNSNDEVFSFVWNNMAWLGIDGEFRIYIDSVKPTRRVGPDGLVIDEIIVDYVQTAVGPASTFIDLHPPQGLDVATPLEVWGGGTIIGDWTRQSRRLDYLVRKNLRDTRHRLGFSLGTPLGQRFAAMHVPDAAIVEEW